MAIESNNPAAQVNVPGPSVAHPLFRRWDIRSWTSPSLADNATYSLGSPTEGNSFPAGVYLVALASDPSKAALYAITTSSGAVSAVTLLDDFAGSTFAADGTTNDRYHLYDTSGEVFLENTTSSAVQLVISRVL